jgi:hypothetical protein
MMIQRKWGKNIKVHQSLIHLKKAHYSEIFEFLMVENMKGRVFSIVTPYRSKRSRRFGRNYLLLPHACGSSPKMETT